MTINEFIKKYGDRSEKIDTILKKWAVKKEVDDFLGMQIMGGYLIGDLLIGDGLSDAIPSELKEAFSGLMKEKADSYQEIRKIIIEKIEKGDESRIGLINKIQGQFGENQFIENVGDTARLAESGSQEAYDIMIQELGATKYVQVKVYEDADAVIEKIKEVNEKIASGFKDQTGNIINEVEFAVNSDIYEEVAEKANELGLPNKILNLGSNREEIREIIEKGFAEVANPGIFDFFSDLLGGTLTVAALHGAINGFLLWKGAKGKQEAIEDIIYSSTISTGGLAVAHLASALFLENITIILGGPILFISGIGARAILKRFFNRRYIVKRLIEGNLKLEEFCLAYS